MASGGEGDTHFVVERRGREEGFDKLFLKMSFFEGIERVYQYNVELFGESHCLYLVFRRFGVYASFLPLVQMFEKGGEGMVAKKVWETEGCGSLSLEKGKRMWLVAKSDHDTARDGMVGWCKERGESQMEG